MGAIFKIEHANIMAFVTSRNSGAPRLRKTDLLEFLEALAYRAKDFLIPERGFEPWPEEIAEAARRALTKLQEQPEKEIIMGATVEKLLEKLRSFFSDYPLFALAVGNGDRLQETALKLASTPMYGQLLVLIPAQESQRESKKQNFEVLDPIPAFSVALHAAADWPGILFWTINGVSAFAKLDEVDDLVRKLREAIHNSPYFPPFRNLSKLDEALRGWSESRQKIYRRLLHLSDLHFGTTDALENQALLDAELRDIVKSVDRVVITGDLFDTPKNNYATLFTTFRNNITHLAEGREPIVITGNHDQRKKGLFGEYYKQVALIGSTKIIVDEKSQMVFICFNSSVKGSLARGRITERQFRQMGGDYRTLIAARPELKRFLPIVLVHHHPFSFDVPPETWVQKILSAFRLRDESFLEMVDAKDLHYWCLDWDIQTILHGHKHKARYIEREISRENKRMRLTAIGCGSSLGAEGSPVSYNMLEWDDRSQKWVASFFESINGGAFREILASVSPSRIEPTHVSFSNEGVQI